MSGHIHAHERTDRTHAEPGNPNANPVTGTRLAGGKYALDVLTKSSVSPWDDSNWFDFVVETTPDYSDGDQLGLDGTDAAVELTDSFTTAGGKGILAGLILTDDDKIQPDLDVYIFSSAPTITSTENAAFDIAEAELDKLVAVVPIRLGHWRDIAGHSIAVVPLNGVPPYAGAQMVQAASGSTSLWAVLVARATLNFATAGALRIKVAVSEK